MDDVDSPLLKLVVESLGTEVKVRSFDLCVCAYLGGIYLQHMQFKGISLSVSGNVIPHVVPFI